jgi:hypothetical protein
MGRIFTLIIFLFTTQIAFAQTTEDYAIELSATVSESPLQVTLKWKPLNDTPIYRIWKKAKTATSWGSPIVTLTATDSLYTDASVIRDSAYEYQVIGTGTTYTSSGYIYAGIRNPAIHNRGTLLLLIDSTFTDSCATQIKTLMQDLSGDGWQLIRHDFARTAADTTIKRVISNDYAAHANVKAALVVGHLAVPYSGDQNPDGHPDHLGAWPADVYYGCITGPWTDVSVNDASAGYAANWNIPGDGKWDAVTIPSAMQLQVGRIDFNNMPAFTATEVQMMRSYLAKDHLYKMDSANVRHRALINDNFGAFGGEAFAANGWRNFAPLVSRDSMYVLPFISTLNTASYQWAYGCGGGSFTSASGIGNTSNFATGPINGIFTMLFGSYFGDWNVQNDFMRAPLCASSPALTSCWAGRPNWFFHHMTLGENIGYAAMLTQNNGSYVYQPANYGANWVHVALMGDLSLRTDYIQPPANLVITSGFHAGATLNWTASPDPGVIGYYVYRADSAYGYFQRVSSSMLTTTTYHDAAGISGTKYYMVRPVKLTATPSGRYYNLGIGITDSAAISFPPLEMAEVVPAVNVAVFPNPASSYIDVTVKADVPVIAHIYLLNEAGQSFDRCTRQLNTGNNVYRLTVSNIPPGVYSLVVETGGKTTIKKWVKL